MTDNLLDPLGDAAALSESGAKKNYAKVGSARPSSLLYNYGPGAIMDLPQFTVMPAGLDDWDRIWARRDGIPRIHAPRLQAAVRTLMGTDRTELRPFPWQAKKTFMSSEGNDLGVPSRVFPQWLRCTGCDFLAPIPRFSYRNTHPYRTDEACFEHHNCPGRAEERVSRDKTPNRKRPTRTAVPARYLLACVDGHLDEFPYDAWVHHWQKCSKDSHPRLKMLDRTSGKGASATILCASCGQKRPMNEAQGEVGRSKLPGCRGRHPHLDSFDPAGCGNETQLMLVGASNLWFASTQAIIVMPESQARDEEVADQLRIDLQDGQELDTDAELLEWLTENGDQPKLLRVSLGKRPSTAFSDAELAAAVKVLLAPPPPESERKRRKENWDPIELLIPEWRYLQKDPLGRQHDGSDADKSGLVLSRRELDPQLPKHFSRVLAAEKLRKVNALIGFTRIDDMDRVDDLPKRLVPVTRAEKPMWTVATEDFGEGIFLQLDESWVRAWEARVKKSDIWAAHEAAHRLNFERRFSETAKNVDHLDRLPKPRYWLVHTLAHVLIREMAMTSGYSAASLSERLYAWEEGSDRPAAAGLLICTTAADSDGTLGGLVQLSEPARLQKIVKDALHRAERCSSDPVCAMRTPKAPEDFLHGAACHCCAMASETSCERANRFLDRRFLIDLPGNNLGFFSRA
ncbi:DUF1998 domain-containing protein [Kineosporia sp. J2-2]|uniref:DUF1998 domain-containing protein n=1 Tax=Kineosporia corallincola TaxID=2835133 RepID=A0ABS5TU38_9ACTN|nr:DUF1998 domain-containing protein [Kineosporia corallincola]MBT0774290.1 DUF1998 domain-containing protein [Kineosporia corallincola]